MISMFELSRIDYILFRARVGLDFNILFSTGIVLATCAAYLTYAVTKTLQSISAMHVFIAK